MRYDKENEEVKKFIAEQRELEPQRIIDFFKQNGTYDESEKDFYIKTAYKNFDKYYEKEHFRNHIPKYDKVDLSEYVEELRSYDDYEERALTIAINKDNGDIIEVCRHQYADEISNRVAKEIYSFILNVAKNNHGTNIGIILMHSHPREALAKASITDIFAFIKKFFFCRDIGVELLDSFVIAKYDVYSEVQEDKERSEKERLLPPKTLCKEEVEKIKNINARAALLLRLYRNNPAYIVV